jgi:ribosomal protein S18 acetylase RimI-like enzyme
MKLTSLGYKSETIFTGFDGRVDDRKSYLVFRTLSNPNYFWGNFLLFDRAPRLGDAPAWIALFKKEFTDPRIYHVTLAWQTANEEVGDISEFLELGYELETKAVMTATDLHPPPKFNEKMSCQPLANAEDWKAMTNLQVDSANYDLPKHEWQKFYEGQSVRYQAMTKAGLGEWYGGYLHGKLVAGLGIFHKAGIGRFQTVCTHPDFRRQGLCGSLVYRASIHAFQEMKVQKLVMCADPDYFALKIYESVGFQREALEYGVYWWDQQPGKKENL